jgi:hypothetical protein
MSRSAIQTALVGRELMQAQVGRCHGVVRWGVALVVEARAEATMDRLDAGRADI